jgi:Putative translation initiation inhibitor, yjgF family
MIISASKSDFRGSASHIESHVTVCAPDIDSLRDFIIEEDREQGSAGLKPCFRRIFLPDDAEAPSEAFCGDAPTSFICQPPLDGNPFAAWLWYENESTAQYAAGIIPDKTLDEDSEAQMREIFEKYSDRLSAAGKTLSEDCLRTWIFVRDIDDNYAGVVKARREFFEKEDMTPKTHYIASTGIAGSVSDRRIKVVMDACSAVDDAAAKPKARYLHALGHLNPTHEYGVTFERGTELIYNDFSRILISGTASIDNRGEVLHVGNASLQCERMLENIGALLGDAGAGLEDIASALVYLREPADAPAVRKVLEEKVPSLNYVMLHAPVCRPAWLVETECIALKRR